MMHSIQFGSKTIEYKLTYSNRKTLGIKVTPEMNVEVVAPLGSTEEKIQLKVKQRAPWIIKQQSYFLSFYPKKPSRKYIGGETHLYMGRQYLLKVTLSVIEDVKYRGRYIEVFAKNKERVKPLLKAWYRKRASLKFEEISLPLIQRFKKYQVAPEGIYLKEMPTRWGSCTPKGKIILNPELIKAPRPCIEYVIVHELCHLIHHNHTQKFIDLQTKEMADWERWKMKLDVLLA